MLSFYPFFSHSLQTCLERKKKTHHICLLAMTKEKHIRNGAYKYKFECIYFGKSLVNKYKCAFRFVCSTFIQFGSLFPSIFFLSICFDFNFGSMFNVFHHNSIHRNNLLIDFNFSWLQKLFFDRFY